MKNLTQRGFTLIELLVVIAIIGILAGILFVAINPAEKINDAKVAKIKASLQGIPTSAVLFYGKNDNFSYDGFCADDSLNGLESEDWNGDGNNANDFECADTSDKWAVQIRAADQYYCIDSTGSGIKENSTDNIADGSDYVC